MTQRSMQRIKDLEIAQDLEFERRSWLAQRVSWVLAMAILLAALFGVFGNGPVSKTEEASHDQSLRIEYQRFVRFQAPAEYRIYVSPQPRSGDTFRLWLNRDFFDGTQLRRIIPEPDSTQLVPDGIIHEFHVSRERDPVEIQFRLEIEKMGRYNPAIALVNQDGRRESQLDFTQFAYP